MATSREWSRIAPSGLPAREMSGSGERNMTQAAKVALLVGAGDAIGAAVARRFARGGFAVCIARREAAKSQALVEEIRSAGGEGEAPPPHPPKRRKPQPPLFPRPQRPPPPPHFKKRLYR